MIDGQISQAAFGVLVGVSQQAVSEMIARGLLSADADARTWLLAYCRNLREQASGRNDTDQARARVALDQERTLEIQLRNAVTKREYAPVSVISEVVARAGRQIATVLEALPGAIRLRWPDIGAEQLKLVVDEVAKARNVAATITIDQLVPAAADQREPA